MGQTRDTVTKNAKIPEERQAFLLAFFVKIGILQEMPRQSQHCTRNA